MTNFIDVSLPMWRKLRRARRLTRPLGLALALLLPAFSACNCPETRHPTPVPDSLEHVRKVEATIANARARRVWTVDDERAFSHNVSRLSGDTAFAYATQIAMLINTQAMEIDRTRPKTPPPPKCPCGTCDDTTVPYQPPASTGGRPTGAQPGTTAPASPSAKQPLQAPTRVP